MERKITISVENEQLGVSLTFQYENYMEFSPIYDLKDTLLDEFDKLKHVKLNNYDISIDQLEKIDDLIGLHKDYAINWNFFLILMSLDLPIEDIIYVIDNGQFEIYDYSFRDDEQTIEFDDKTFYYYYEM
jgi:hypothetical protein